MDLLHLRCAGIDVHKTQLQVCVRVVEGQSVHKTVREFGTTTPELLRLREWLEREGVTHVAMEATGTYWKPVWHVLEGTVELLLANAREVKAVPGRKSDVLDCQWLADLLARINDHRITDLDALLPWRWAAERERRKLAA